MRRHFGIEFCAVVFFCTLLVGCGQNSNQPTANAPNVPAATAGVSPQPTPVSYDFASLDNLLERIARKHGGCALVVVQGEQVIYRKGFGTYTPDKVIPIASASKWLSGALIMRLVDEGKLSLDDRVSKYIPEFADEKANLTIRQLFAHTSGLPPEAGCRNDKRTTLERCAAEIAQVRLRAAPGEEFYYGGVSMHVAGRMAEVATGRSWNELFVEKIAAPLGMEQTDFFAYGPTGNPRPAGDARSSVDEYARFLRMVLQRGTVDGKQILSASSVTEMHKDQTGGARITYTIYERHAALDPGLLQARYGIGMWCEKVNDSGQLLEASSQGALGFSPWIDVERNLAGVLSIRSSFSLALPDYLAVKDQIRRTVPPQNGPFQASTANSR
ncbi:MAG: beta-lactamase family protein [Acidobacteria bacterium]|nr:beta-lactamase family protein [Acidobacteriota bacterium]